MFLYEVSLYKITPTEASILASKYYQSDKILDVKEAEVIKKSRDFIIERFITYEKGKS